jgi:Tat protein secretion system quality control protein TatD with DNase activity
MHLRHVLETVARYRGETVEALARTTTDNARRLFGWP